MKQHEKELVMIEKLKMLQIREKAHRKIKELAVKRNLTMKDYVEYLIELDEDIIKEKE